MKNPQSQISIDFEYDDRIVKLAAEFSIMMAPHLAPGIPKKIVTTLAARMAMLAGKRVNKFVEPKEPMRCHTCDDMTQPDDRTRVVVCNRCSFTGGSPGSTG